MPLERAPAGTSLIDVLDRVLDKGIVIDASVRLSLVGIDRITVDERGVVASTYEEYQALVRRKRRKPTEGSGSGGAPTFAGTADLIPRAQAGRHRKPID